MLTAMDLQRTVTRATQRKVTPRMTKVTRAMERKVTPRMTKVTRAMERKVTRMTKVTRAIEVNRESFMNVIHVGVGYTNIDNRDCNAPIHKP